MTDHWVPDLERWFPEGLETAGIAMIHIRTIRIHHWDGENEGDMVIRHKILTACRATSPLRL